MSYSVEITFGGNLSFKSTSLKEYLKFKSWKLDSFMEFSNEDETITNFINLNQAKIITIRKEKQENSK